MSFAMWSVDVVRCDANHISKLYKWFDIGHFNMHEFYNFVPLHTYLEAFHNQKYPKRTHMQPFHWSCTRTHDKNVAYMHIISMVIFWFSYIPKCALVDF